jgi:serine/threonine protein kinase
MPRYIGQFELGQILGSGGFGKVYLGHDTKSKDEVAVKIIDKQLIRANHMEAYVEREIAIMKRLQHPHVIKLKTVVELPSAYCLVMELASNGELFDKILDARRFDERTARNYFQQLVSAVMYCHSKGVVHRDLKAENLLLGEKNSLKVCDFGLSRYTLRNGAPDSAVKFMSLAGSPDYQAPEMNNPNADGYSGETCDVWSCGVILFFMLAGYLPFTGRDDEETASRINHAKYDRSCKYLSESASDLISRILTADPDERITFPEIVQHHWFSIDLDPQLFPNVKPDASPVNGLVAPVNIEEVKEHCGDSLVAQLRRAFYSCNVDHTGHLKRSEVRDVLIALNNGNPVADEEIEAVMDCFARDQDGTISEEEFVQGWATADKRLGGRLPLARLVNIFHYDLERDLLADLRRAFDKLDINKSGVVTAETVMKLPELSLNEADAKVLISAMDSHHCGTVTFEDFVRAVMSADILQTHQICSKLQRVRELFECVDRSSFLSYLNIGFTVAGFREQIANKLMDSGKTPPCNTSFDPGDTGTYLHGVHEDEAGRRLEVGVQLLPAATGYTKVLAYRIAGKTEVFHRWFGKFRGLLHEEIVQCVEDTSVKGDSELM